MGSGLQVVAGPELRSPRPGEEGNSPPAPPGTAWHFRAESMPEKVRRFFSKRTSGD